MKKRAFTLKPHLILILSAILLFGINLFVAIKASGMGNNISLLAKEKSDKIYENQIMRDRLVQNDSMTKAENLALTDGFSRTVNKIYLSDETLGVAALR